jgi:Putative adhesin
MATSVTSRIAAVLVFGSLAMFSAGCNALDFAPLVTAKATITEEFHTGSEPQLVIETFNGSIDVSDGENDEVVVEVTKSASGFDQEAAESNLNYVEVSMVQKGDTIHVTARRAGRHVGSCGAAVVVAAPKGATVRLKSSNGRVVCEGLAGGIEARTSNGQIVVVDGHGAIDVGTSNGGIEIEAVDAQVEARTSNGRIAFHGTLRGKDNQFKSSNGRIELGLPGDSAFHIDCSTSNARVQCEFPLEDKDSKSRRRLSGTVGDDPRFSLVAATSNAGISIRKQELAAK